MYGCMVSYLSTDENLSVVCDYLGMLVGPLQKTTVPVNPKTQQPGNWGLMVDLSCHKKHSINDGIAK